MVIGAIGGVISGAEKHSVSMSDEVVVCQTERFAGNPIGCTKETEDKKCVREKKKDGTIVYGRCTPYEMTYPEKGVHCPCW